MRQLTLFLLGCWTIVSAGVAYADANVQPPSVTFDRAIYFIAGEGNDVPLPPGIYGVEQAGQERLRLVPGDSQPPIEIQAASLAHDESLTAPVSMAVIEEGQDDQVHVVFLLPNGEGLDAMGSFSGTRSRATARRPFGRMQVQAIIAQSQMTSQSSLYLRVPMSSSRVNAPPPAAPPPPTLKVPPASAAVIATPSPKMPTTPIVSGSKPNPHVTLIQGRSKPEGPLTWSYLRMHEPDTILAMIKAVQAGIRHPKTLTGLASLRNLDTLLKTKYPDGFTAKSLPKVSAPIEGQVSTRGVVPSIRDHDHVQAQVQSSAIPPISSSTSGAVLTLPKKQGNGWNDLFTMGGGGVLDTPKAIQPTPQEASLLDSRRAARLFRRVDYTPEQLNLGSLYKDQTTRAILHVTAPVDGKVTASIPTASTPFKIVKVRALSGWLIYQPVTILNKRTQVAREQETAQATAAPFSVPATSGQTVEITVEFAPRFELFGNRGTFVGNHAATLGVDSDLWSAEVPIVGRFLGVNIGVLAIPDTTDVVAYCPNAFPAGFTFLNATGRPQQVTLTSFSTPNDVHLNAVCTGGAFECYKWEDRPFTFVLGPGERKHMDIPLRCGYSYEEGSVTMTYSYEGTKRQATFDLRPYPSMMKWTGSQAVSFPDPDAYPWDSCHFNWSVFMTPDGAFATTVDFGRFPKEYIKEPRNADLDHWAGIQVKFRDLNLGQIWSSYRGFVNSDTTESRYTTGGKEIPYVTFKPNYGYPNWQGVLPQIQASYTDLTREGPIVRLACGESGIDGNPDNPF